MMKPMLIKLTIIVFILAFQIQLVNYYYVDLVPTHIFISFFIAVLSAMLLVLQLLSKKYRKSNWNLILTTIPILGFVLGLGIHSYQESERQLNAEIIISALDEFKAVKGEYPKNLSDLSPKYIETIPKSHWGIQSIDFDYTKENERNEFGIKYDLITGCSFYYHSSMKVWQFSD